MRGLVGVGFLVLALLCSGVASAQADCRCCKGLTEAEAAQAADVIFIGEVVSSEHRLSLVNWSMTQVKNLFRADGGEFMAPWMKRTATLTVATSLKGQISGEPTIHTLPSIAWCGVDFEVGETYLVYAQESGFQLWTGQCAGSRKIVPEFEQLATAREGVPVLSNRRHAAW